MPNYHNLFPVNAFSKMSETEYLSTYDPSLTEESVLEFWEEHSIYEKVKKKNEGGKKFYFLDGPPYVTNIPHVGTAWNKVLKDLVLRFKRMQGFNVHDKPGYDCHGLPIEVRVEGMLGVKSKKDIERIGVDRFIKECKNFAVKYEKLQTKTFKRLGVWMDWNNPYLTYKNDYVESAWWTLKQIYDRGLLERGLKVVHWCPRCETALAGYEIADEYRVVKDPSIYVKFPIVDRENEFLLIWTTTPWTIPANVAVMVHPDFTYSRVKTDRGTLILAKDLCETVFKEIGVRYRTLESFNGHELDGLRYKHPLIEEVPFQATLKNAHKVVLSREYVHLKEGTGCVHSAPGHGEEDFEVGVAHELPVVTLIGSDGRFTKEGGKYEGLSFKEANDAIVEDLRRKGLLLYEASIHHPYPHCWRCKAKLVLRATKQWFIKVTVIKDAMMKANEEIEWVPQWAGSRRFKDWLASAKDWVISRQRYWGVPLPIWTCRSCGRIELVSSRKELGRKGALLEGKTELHKPWVDRITINCPCGSTMNRIPDVLDVWVDSGIAGWASLDYPREKDLFEKLWPVDLIIEAHDQTRGWFYSLLSMGIALFDVTPYKSVLMHGHTLDEKGRRMSKSLGNVVWPEDIIKKYGSDTLRLYSLQRTIWEDFSFKWNEIKSCFATLNTLWNVYRFVRLYMKLDKFDPNRWSLRAVSDKLTVEDRWLLSRCESLKKDVTEQFNRYHFHEGVKLMVDFILEDLSRLYIKIVRRRLWMEEKSDRKIATYATLYHTLKSVLLLLAPVLPFLTERIYLDLIKPVETGAPESVHLCDWPQPNDELVDKKIESMMMVVREAASTTLSLRQKARLKLRWPVKSVAFSPSDAESEGALERFKDAFLSLTNAKELIILKKGELVTHPDFIGQPSKYGEVYLDTSRTPELIREAFVKELVRRAQSMRKEMGLKVEDYVNLVVVADEDSLEHLSNMKSYIMGEVRIKSMMLSSDPGKITKDMYARGWDIEGKRVRIGVIKVPS
jgi:isoleucyl-tRNA synthetase